ncbi:MAG: hypothetical protein JNL64_07145 [Blastocatellia bacterium]|nr:hypothetical protein [Blastocatellia bacterium]
MQESFSRRSDRVLSVLFTATSFFVVFSILSSVKINYAQNREHNLQILERDSTIHTVLPLNDGCVLVVGALSPVGDNFIVRTCGKDFKITNVGPIGFFDRLLEVEKNKIWGIVSGSLVKLELKDKLIRFNVVKRKSANLFLTDLTFVDEKHGWACGDDGKIIFTRDGGGTWSEANSTTNLNLRRIRFADKDFGWSLGGENTQSGFYSVFLTTRNGGISWERRELPDSKSFDAASFTSGFQGCGLMSNTKVLCTGGGTKWYSSELKNNNISDVYFVNEQIGFVVGDTISKTDDTGKTWLNKVPEDITSPMLSKIIFKDRTTGFAWGLRTVLKTTDGGETWNEISSPWFGK